MPKLNLPKQVKYIVGTEACERFSYYGMRSILVIYMTKMLVMPEAEAKSTYHLFVGSSYFLAIAGAFLADRFWGRYSTILWLSVVYVLGHVCMSLGEDKNYLYIGLSLIAIGAGGIKPCVSALVGDQLPQANKKQYEKIFELFYFGVNVGAFFSMLIVPWAYARYGGRLAFAIPAVLMALALVIYWLGRHDYIKVKPVRKRDTVSFWAILFTSCCRIGSWKPGRSFLNLAADKYGKESVDAAKGVLGICAVFVWVIGFWALYDQSGASWVLQAEKLDLNFLGIQWEAAQIQSSNGIFVLILIPLFSFGLYPLIEKLGIKLTALRKMSAGMVMTAVSFAIIWAIQVALENGQMVSVGWQFLAFILLSAAEVMVSIPGLEFAYTQSPPSMKSSIMSLWFLTLAFGNYLTALISWVNRWQGSREFMFYIILMLVVAVGLIFTASRYKLRNYAAT